MNRLFAIFFILLIGTYCFAKEGSVNESISDNVKQEKLRDDFVLSTLSAENLSKPATNINYNYQDTDVVRIPLFIVHPIKSEKDVYEGQVVKFRVAQKVIYNKKVLVRNGQIVTARIETIIPNGMNGIPASIVFGGFNVPNLEKSKISAYYEHFGLDLSLIVYPLKWALTILPPTGSLTNFIKGGHANIRGYETVSIYYHPNWN